MSKQRDAVVMSAAEVDELLHQQRSATVATYGPNGAIHLVAMWYAYLDGEIWIETKAKSQKVVNLRRDDRMSVLVEAGQEVASGDTLLVLEAMKMETEVTAPKDGTIGAVEVAVGDAVQGGQVLIEWADEAEADQGDQAKA